MIRATRLGLLEGWSEIMLHNEFGRPFTDYAMSDSASDVV